MTTRETTLGALTAADLGKRVRLPSGRTYRPHRVGHDGGATTLADLAGNIMAPSTTPVTVYDEEEA